MVFTESTHLRWFLTPTRHTSANSFSKKGKCHKNVKKHRFHPKQRSKSDSSRDLRSIWYLPMYKIPWYHLDLEFPLTFSVKESVFGTPTQRRLCDLSSYWRYGVSTESVKIPIYHECVENVVTIWYYTYRRGLNRTEIVRGIRFWPLFWAEMMFFRRFYGIFFFWETVSTHMPCWC